MSQTDQQVQQHLTKLKKLLSLEKDEDILQTQTLLDTLDPKSAQKRCLSLLNMRIGAQRSGIGGKVLVDFELSTDLSAEDLRKSKDPLLLALQSFRQGDIVGLASSGDGKDGQVSGVVWKCGESSLTLAFRDDDSVSTYLDQNSNEKIRLNKLANDVHYSRMEKALDTVSEQLQSAQLSEISRTVLGSLKKENVVLSDGNIPATAIEFFNAGLNESQKSSIDFALNEKRLVALILGPPGTGKTTTVVEIIRQYLAQGKRLLVCTPSNIAVDNILERLPSQTNKKSSTGAQMVRIGHPARILPAVMEYSLDYQLRQSDGGQIVDDIKREIDATLAKVSKAKSYGDRKELYQQIKILRKDLRKREPQVLNQLIGGCRAVFTTLSSCGSRMLQNEKFDILIMDEVSQSMEPECWIALLKCQKAILVGDPHQLPPTVVSRKAEGLTYTLFSRLTALYGDGIKKTLTVQYRMHPTIMEWCNQNVYDKQLSGETDIDWLLCHLPNIQRTDDTIEPLILVDTAGFSFYECSADDGEDTGMGLSRWNEGEASICVEHVKDLIKAGTGPDQIAIISPYAAQVRFIKDLLHSESIEGVEVGTVDGFQGREKECIIVTMVRSNDDRQVGFLADKRRLNVAMTRARRQLFVVCDSETLSEGDAFMSLMIDYLMDHADIRYPKDTH